MEIKYVGTLPEGWLPDHIAGKRYDWKKGIPFEVRDEFGEQLIKKQPLTWRKAVSSKRTKKEGD